MNPPADLPAVPLLAEPLPGASWALEIPLADLDTTAQFAGRLAGQLGAGDLLVLTGGLGAGKTTFTQALAEALGVQGQVSSPTFVLSRIHRSAGEGPDLVHVDAYRTDAEGMESLDLTATLPQSVTVVEWGRGLVEQPLVGAGGSWLDIELRIPEPGRPAQPGDGGSPASWSEGVIRTDFSETDEDLLGSPRTAVLRGFGPRWAAPPVLG